MNFLKNLSKKTKIFKDSVVAKLVKPLINSSSVIKSVDALESFIGESKTTTFTSKDGETNEFIHKVIIIFGEKKSGFFEKALIQYPVLKTKCYSQNIKLKLCDLELDLIKSYGIEGLPSLVIFEGEEVFTIVEGESDISQIVGKFSLDIIGNIENLH